MKNQPRKHHYVPECYLRNFSNNGFIYRLNPNLTYEVKKPILNRRNISAICYYEDFYTIDESIPDKEEFLSLLGSTLGIETRVNTSWENKFGSMLNHLLTGKYSRQECVDFAEFIVHLKFRNPYYLNKIIVPNKDKWLDQTSEEISIELCNDKRYDYLSKENKEVLMDFVTNSAKKNSSYAKRILLSLVLNRWKTDKEGEYIPHMINYGWQILEAENGCEFITSDNPGFTIEMDTGTVQNTKFTDRFAFHFPLTSKQCLLISDEISVSNAWNENGFKEIPIRPVSVEMVQWINFYSMQLINKMVIAKNSDPLKYLADCVLKSK